jgi:hypothetical protein
VLITIEHSVRMQDREAGNTQTQRSRTCDGTSSMNFVRTRGVGMLDEQS